MKAGKIHLLNRIYFYFSVPALIIHELSHILGGALSGYFFDLKRSNYRLFLNGASAYYLMPKKDKRNLLQLLLMPIAPLYTIILVLIASCFNHWFFILFSYQLITYKYSFHSQGDWWHLRYAKVYKRFGQDYNSIQRFFIINGLIEIEEEDLSWILENDRFE